MKETEVAAWQEIAFEEVCLQHIEQIKHALQIGGVSSRESAYVISGDAENAGTQIDLLIDRDDDVVNLCEIKYYKEPFTVSKSYNETLEHWKSLMQETFPGMTFHLTFIGSSGLNRTSYSDIFVSEVTAEDLFV